MSLKPKDWIQDPSPFETHFSIFTCLLFYSMDYIMLCCSTLATMRLHFPESPSHAVPSYRFREDKSAWVWKPKVNPQVKLAGWCKALNITVAEPPCRTGKQKIWLGLLLELLQGQGQAQEKHSHFSADGWCPQSWWGKTCRQAAVSSHTLLVCYGKFSWFCSCQSDLSFSSALQIFQSTIK